MNSTNPMYTEQVTMTPAKAQELLDRSDLRNRKATKSLVSELSRRILEGEWQCSPQGISLCPKGNIVDGQHRLLAIAKSGISVPIRVTYNTPPETFTILDCGKKRTAGDILYIQGVDKYAAGMAAATKSYVQYQLYPTRTWANRDTDISHKEISRSYEEKRDLITLYQPIVMSNYRISNLFNKTAAIVFCLLAHEKGWLPEEIKSFWEMIGTGANLENDSVLLSYRNQLSQQAFRKRGQVRSQYQLNAAIKAFNDFKDGRTGKYYAPQADAKMYTLVHRDQIIPPKHDIVSIHRYSS